MIIQKKIQEKIGQYLKYGLIKRIAESFGFAVYEPFWDYMKPLTNYTEFEISDKTVRDNRPSTIGNNGIDLTLSTEGFADILDTTNFINKRVLEVGPKYGIHSRWIDKNLKPSELVFCDFESDKWRHEAWENEILCRHRWVYGDLRIAHELLLMQRFDLVFFLGVIYHSAYPIQLLSMLNRVTILGGTMLFETTFDPRPDAVLRVNWQAKTGKAKMVPSLDALRVILAWTGWRKVCLFKNYRPGSSEILLLCQKTDDLVDIASDFCSVVTTARLGPDGPLIVN
jgi:SAM-dependent methyltransferase